MLFKLVLLVSTGALLQTGCVYHERVVYREPGPPPAAGEVVVTEAPPAAVVEQVTVSPGVGFIWIPGAWVWEGRWVWARGHWDRPPRPGARWVPPHYVYRGGVHIFVRGGWR
jgi:WXXGXW repeat (2 copies)